ncbi:GRIP domain-containing protein [Lactarius deliciosus]|nr:GRIP domain-containing protein [Lactarius deliciosus]
MAALKESQKTEHDKEQLDRERLQGELNKLKIEKEVSLADHRAQFEKELATLKQRSEKELIALRGQFELESIAAKSNQEQAMGLKDTQIGRLERSVQSLSAEKNNLFDQLQMRQAEVESAQSLLEVLQNQNTELQYQIREKDDRIALLHEELNDARQEQHAAVSDPSTSPEVAKLLAAADSRYETKLSLLKQELAAMEAERVEVEAEWRGKVEVKVQETQKWKAMVDSTSQSRQDDDGRTQELQAEVEKLQSAARAYDHEVSQLKRQVERSTIDQEITRQQLSEQVKSISSLDQQLEEIKAKELQARTHNKTLRDELRKVQSSAAILNRQRGPGVGHWGSANNTGATTPSSPTSSQTAGSPDSPSNDEDVNVEYLRNVILQFLEHKEMRPNLVRVLSTILRFTPQETRRLIAKV